MRPLREPDHKNRRPPTRAPLHRRTLAPIGGVIDQVLKKRKIDSRVHQARVFAAFSDACSEIIRKHVSAVRFRGGELTVAVDSATWRQQLTFLVDELRDKANARLGKNEIAGIRLVHGAAPTEIEPAPSLPPRVEHPLSHEAHAVADRLSHLVEDHALGAIIARAYLNAKRFGR